MRKLKLLIAAAALAMCSVANAQTWTGNAPAEGTFFLYNVGADKFINNGDPAESWGTNAYLQAGFGLDITLEANNGAYNLNTNVSNGGDSHYLATSTWCDGDATPWTFTAVEGKEYTYTIKNGDSYLVANDDFNDIVYGTLTNDNKSWWKLVSLDDFKTAMRAKAYSATDPMDVSVFILGRSFARNDGRNNSWTATHNGGNWTWIGASANKYYGNEAWNNTFSVSQTIEGLPDGTYELKCSGFGTNSTTYIFANNTSKLIQSDNTTERGSSKEAKWTAIHEDNAFAGQTTGTFTLSGGNLNLGIKRETNSGGDWAIWDEFRLYYYGLDLSEFAATLATAVAAAQAIEEGSIPTSAYNALTAVVTENNKSYTIAADYTAAADAIEEATATATTLQAPYASYKSLKDAVLAISNDLNIADAESAAEAATTVDELTAAEEALRTTLKTYLKTTDQTNIDLTAALLINPSFENGFSSGWTNTGMAIQNNTSFEKDGNNYCEKWQPNGTFSVKQTITLPAGVYAISAKAKARGVTSAKLFANGIETPVTVQDATDTYTVQFACDDNAEVEFGFEGIGTGAGSSWLCVDDFHLTLVSAGLPDVTAVTGKMNADVATAQTTAIETYYANKTIANYNAASAAIAAAEASKAAYAKMPQAIADATALKDAHNFVTAAAATTFAEAIAAAQTGYDNGTLTDAEANNYANLGASAVGWHNSRAEADWTSAEAYMKSAGFNAEFNDWSVEGVADGSDYLVPFFQDWVNNSQNLTAKTVTGTLANLENGLYKVSAWVRVRAKDGTAATGATGITMDVNGGTATDVTEGTQVGETQFQLATYEAQGLVKNGTLTVNFNIADANISWLSFKNVKYTKVRDLTPEEMAVIPANLALDATATVFQGKTITLTPTSTTENASIDGFVNWSSDNENVATVDANGVVTGVAYGTANITATSSLNADAIATCAVTVTAPLITEAENLDFAMGPVVENHIRTYAKDKTGTDVAQMQEVTGWSFGVANGDAKAAGVMAYGSSYGMGSDANTFFAPAINPDGEATGNALGMVGVWTGSVQYVQNVKIPAGAYTITVPVYRSGGASALTKNLIGVILDDGTEHLATSTVYENSWTTETIKFTISEDTYGKLSLGLNAPNVGSNNSQRLWIDGMNITCEPFATSEEIAALNEAIETAEGHTLGFDKDEYAPYANVTALEALAAAKELNTENPIAQSDVTAATDALSNATWTPNTEEVNAVYDGTFAAAVNNGAPAGWTMSNNTLGGAQHSRAFVGDERLSEFNETNSGFFLRFDGTNSDRGSMYYYGNTTGYTMPLKSNTYYLATVDFAGWGYTGKPLRMNVTGPDGFAVNQQYNTSVQADNADNTPQQFNILFQTASAGNYVINFQTPGDDSNKHNVVISNVMLKSVTPIEISESETYTPVEVKNAYVTFKRTLVEGWNGMVLPFDMSVEDAKNTFNATAIKDFTGITSGSDGITLKFTDATEITAGKPFMMKVTAPAEGNSYTISNVSLSDAAVLQSIEKTDGTGKYTMTGTYKPTNLTDVTFALIQGDKYYYHNTGKSSSAKAFRAYFVDESTDGDGSRISFNFGDDVITGINELQANGQNAEAVYNLQGQRVVNAKKGLFIQNGKKVVRK